MGKNKNFNLLNITKVSLSLAAMFLPVIISSENVNATPVKNPGAKVTTSMDFGKYMRNYANVTTPTGGYVSLVSGRGSKGSPNTPMTPTAARHRMLAQIFEETGQAIVTTNNTGNIQFRSQPPSNGQSSNSTVIVRTSSGKIIKINNQTGGPKLGTFPIIPQDGSR